MSGYRQIVDRDLRLRNLDRVTLLRESFNVAKPYNHLVIDAFLEESLAKDVSSEVSDLAQDVINNTMQSSWRVFRHESGYAGLHKYEIHPEAVETTAQRLLWSLNSAEFLGWLESVTGLTGLIPDPYFLGGGVHCTGTGGRLGIHTDFRQHRTLALKRELNLLIYLNENWRPEYGGHLQLLESPRSRPVEIEYKHNRAVLFRTSRNSWHGHPDEIASPPEQFRTSLALYYYTAFKDGDPELLDVSTTRYATVKGSGLRDRMTVSKFRIYNSIAALLPRRLRR